ncbi:MAG: hypothetical protein LBC27_00930 [Spirochaetaceae bacterium]|jgi:hypothetical protein|nr:hypothetical protein [Spirochaetaceae bacterium]
MRNFARFLIFLGLCFIFIFIISFGIALLHCWIDDISHVPAANGILLKDILEKERWILPFTLYLTIIFSVVYGKKQRIAAPFVFILIIIISGTFTFITSRGIENVIRMTAPPIAINHGTLGSPGLILSRTGIIITLLDQPSDETGSRVVSIRDKPFIYQKIPEGADGEIINLPPVPFRGKKTWFSTGIVYELSISGRQIAERFNEGTVPFLSWMLALTILLVSLGIVSGISSWPLANIFLGLLAFRGILAFEVFLNSVETMEYLKEFARGILPDIFITPAILTLIAALILLYCLLLFLARLSDKTVKSKV